MDIPPSATSAPAQDDEGNLCHGLSPIFKDENEAFFSSLFAQLHGDSPVALPEAPYLSPDLRFVVGEEKLDTHVFIMGYYCSKLATVLVKSEEGEGGVGVKFVTCIANDIGVTSEAFKTFRKVIYLKELTSTTFDIWLQVRRLAEHLGCRMVLKKTDEVRISLANCHIVFHQWPQGSEVREKALNFTKRNLRTLVDTEKSLYWCEELWQTILSLNDLTPPVPFEDELFEAVLKWQGKNSGQVDAVDLLRCVFRDFFRYPLMSEDFLLSPTFRDSGILDFAEILTIYDEKKGRGLTNFNRTPRSSASTCRSPFGGSDVRPGVDATSPVSTAIQHLALLQGDAHSQDDGLEGQADHTSRTNGHENDLSNPCNPGSIRRRNVTGPRNVKSVYARPTPQFQWKIVELKRVVGNDDELPRVTDSDPTTKSAHRSQQKRKRLHSKSECPSSKRPSIASSSLAPSGGHSSTQVSSPSQDPDPTPRKKSVVADFNELQEAIKVATPGHEIKLRPGIFEGQLTIKNLSAGVRIFGAGPATIVRATGAPTFIWHIVDAGKNCIFEDIKFESNEWGRNEDYQGLVTERSDGVQLRNLDFVGCHLAVNTCDGADIDNVRVESSKFGIALRPEVKNAVVKNAIFKNLTEGLAVRGKCNILSDIQCIDVQEGVTFVNSGKTQHGSCHGNTLTNLTYSFSNVECKNRHEGQMAVQIGGSGNNKLENIKCLGFNEIPRSAQDFAYALWIPKQVKGSTQIPSKNIIKGVSGGRVWVGGKENVIEDVTDCSYLTAIGLRHSFTNCAVGKAYVEMATDVVSTNCNFGR